MQLSERMRRVAEKVEKCDLIADIGTDHAYIPIYLVKNGVIKRAIAGDISKGSVMKAAKNIIRNGCEERIETRVGNGLKILGEGEYVDTVIMSGMGGMLMKEIMRERTDIIKNTSQLVLQPQRDIDKVRRYLHDISFRIENEDMFTEDGKYYNIIVCRNGKEDRYSEREYLFGKKLIDEKNEVLSAYIEKEMRKMKNVINSMKDRKEEHILKRKKEIENEYRIYGEVAACLTR
ncbi:MAG: SAM-dependent methyltransferase [Firmicutes bacterium]|nr:SAM-dependent methyltransferase [Bacillota bacterium]